jgi:AbrB family looped-hinge helix DNA binding protein
MYYKYEKYYKTYLGGNLMEAPKGKHIFGKVKVGTKGQIVIPKEAREIFNIKPGDSLLMLGDEEQGIALVKQELLLQFANDILNVKSFHVESEDE